jgi:hypothetical protein
MSKYRNALLAASVMALIGISGCKRDDDAHDNRTLEKKPHVETVKPVDRSDAFRP